MPIKAKCQLTKWDFTRVFLTYNMLQMCKMEMGLYTCAELTGYRHFIHCIQNLVNPNPLN